MTDAHEGAKYAMFEVRVSGTPIKRELHAIEAGIRRFLIESLDPEYDGDVDVELIEWAGDSQETST